MSQSYLKMNKDHAAEIDAELVNLRAENKRLRESLRGAEYYAEEAQRIAGQDRLKLKKALKELDESYHTPSNTAMWEERYRRCQQELTATDTAWQNAELREAAIKKRIAESPAAWTA